MIEPSQSNDFEIHIVCLSRLLSVPMIHTYAYVDFNKYIQIHSLFYTYPILYPPKYLLSTFKNPEEIIPPFFTNIRILCKMLKQHSETFHFLYGVIECSPFVEFTLKEI